MDDLAHNIASPQTLNCRRIAQHDNLVKAGQERRALLVRYDVFDERLPRPVVLGALQITQPSRAGIHSTSIDVTRQRPLPTRVPILPHLAVNTALVTAIAATFLAPHEMVDRVRVVGEPLRRRGQVHQLAADDWGRRLVDNELTLANVSDAVVVHRRVGHQVVLAVWRAVPSRRQVLVDEHVFKKRGRRSLRAAGHETQRAANNTGDVVDVVLAETRDREPALVLAATRAAALRVDHCEPLLQVEAQIQREVLAVKGRGELHIVEGIVCVPRLNSPNAPALCGHGGDGDDGEDEEDEEEELFL